jgi:hypothetical protein
VTAITHLHHCTATPLAVTPQTLERWVDRPLLAIRHACAVLPRAESWGGVIARLTAELHEALAGRTLCVSWIHGDFWASNLLLHPLHGGLSGIVDWDRAASGELPVHDALHLVVQQRKLLARCHEPNGIVRALLRGAPWTRDESALLEAVEWPLGPHDSQRRTVLLLYWLRCTAAYVSQYPRRARDEQWVAHNVERVLRCL